MSVYELLLFVIVALICGSIARSLGGGSSGGCLVSLAVAFIGALLGGKLSQVLHLPEPISLQFGGHSMPVVWSIIGGALFVAALRLLGKRSDR